MKKVLAKVLAVAMLLSIITGTPAPAGAAVKKPKLAKKRITVMVGKSSTLLTKNVSKKTKVKIKQSTASKKIASVKWNKQTKKLKIGGKKKGTTTVTVMFTKSKKTFRTKLKITVKKKIICVLPPKRTEAPTEAPSATAEVSPSPTVSPSASPIVTVTPLPTFEAEYEDDITPIKDIYSDYFMVGAAINGSAYNTMALHHKGMAGILKKHFNSTVMSNLMKPEHTLDEAASRASADGMPVCKFDTCDAALKFCMDNGIKMRGHTLVWHNQAPEWFFYEDYDTTKDLVDAETMDRRMESYIRQVITHCQDNFPGVVYCWDVVNECVCVDKDSYIVTKGGWKLRASTKSDNDFTHDDYVKNYWYATMGETYVEKAFEYARKYADKDVKLFYNDYNVFQTDKMNNIYMMVDELKEKGLIDGIGLQPTVLIDWPELDTDNAGSFKTCLEKYAELGLEIQVTELSFKLKGDATEKALQNQADRYREFMGLLLKEDSDNGGPCNITSVTVFGICDDYPLYDNFSQNLYLWDKNCVPKPCLYAFIEPGLNKEEK